MNLLAPALLVRALEFALMFRGGASCRVRVHVLDGSFLFELLNRRLDAGDDAVLPLFNLGDCLTRQRQHANAGLEAIVLVVAVFNYNPSRICIVVGVIIGFEFVDIIDCDHGTSEDAVNVQSSDQ